MLPNNEDSLKACSNSALGGISSKPISQIQNIKSPYENKKSRHRNKTLGDNSFKTLILKSINDAEKGFTNTKNTDKEMIQIHNSNIKILPHEFLYLMVNANDRLEVLSNLPRCVIKNPKQEADFGYNIDTIKDTQIYLLSKDHRENKSPFRRMK